MIRIAYVTNTSSDNYAWYVVKGINEADCRQLVEREHEYDYGTPEFEMMTIEEANEEYSRELPADYCAHIESGRVILFNYGS